MVSILEVNLRELRERSGLRAEEVAAKLKIALSTLRNWEQGKHKPTMNPDQYYEVTQVYKCTYEEFRSAVNETIEGYQND